MGTRSENAPAVGEGEGWHWIGWIDEEGWPLGTEPCNCEEKTSHTEQRR